MDSATTPSRTDELDLTHTIPTHLAMPETVLSLGTFTLTARQLALLFLGGSLTYSFWWHTMGLATWLAPLGMTLHTTLLLMLVGIVLALTFGGVAGRSLDIWLFVLAAYLSRPRLYLWRNLPQLAPQSGIGRIEDPRRHMRRKEDQHDEE
jgi:hypothetical protein